MKRTLIALLLLALAAACTEAENDPIANPTTTTSPTVAAASAGPRSVTAFADLAEVPLLGDAPPYAGPATPTSLDGVLWADQVPDVARALLEANGFAVLESQIGQFHEAYSNVELSSRQPLYVTTDAAYHYWHLAFAKALRDTEQDVLLPILEDFALGLEEAAAAQADALRGTDLEDAAAQVARYGELLVALLELRPGPFSAEVDAELALIRDHLDFGTSPTTGARVDYSQLGPRGHYTRTPELTRYFLAMASLGQTAFIVGDRAQLRTGLLLAEAITSDDDLQRAWTQIYEPTAFLVGLADDYTPAEVISAADAVDPAWRDSPDAVDERFLAALAGGELRGLREVAIDPEYASMRVMGARLVLDSYLLDQLVAPTVPQRLEASALDVAAAFGSEWARTRQVEAGTPEEYPGYLPQLDEMTALVSGRTIAEWAGTVYDAWLHALQPMWSAHGAAYPDLMRTDAWAAKAHNAGFGSYAELKHDTVLYAKQAFAEGEAPPAPAEPRHWVEPEPVAYGRLAAVATLMRDGLGARDLLAPDVDDVLGRLIEVYGRFERLARDELAGRPISAEDNEWLETISSRFELLWLLTSEDSGAAASTGGFAEGPDDIAALVVDIMSNPEQALEIGTGHIDQIFVLVPNDDGVFQVARGGVYSYYEFWVPRGERLTDEEWRQLLADGDQPDRPTWTDAFLVEQ